MAILGFLALLAAGVYLMFAGLGGTLAMYGFSGKILWIGLIMAAAGAAFIYLAVINCPFTLSVTPSK